MDQLRTLGWAVGPAVGRDDWRRAVRAEARRVGIEVRTGEAPSPHIGADDRVYPWAVTVAHHEAMRELFGGLSLDILGAAVVGRQGNVEALRNRW